MITIRIVSELSFCLWEGGCLTVSVTRKWVGRGPGSKTEFRQGSETSQKTRRIPLVGFTLCSAAWLQDIMLESRAHTNFHWTLDVFCRYCTYAFFRHFRREIQIGIPTVICRNRRNPTKPAALEPRTSQLKRSMSQRK